MSLAIGFVLGMINSLISWWAVARYLGPKMAISSCITIVPTNIHSRGQPQRFKFISRRSAYHGVTYGALALGGLAEIKGPFEPLPPGFIQVANTGEDPEGAAEQIRTAIEFGPPSGRVGRALWEAVEHRQAGLFSQLITVPLFHRHRILCQVAGHRMNTIKALPALVVQEDEIRRFAGALEETIASAERYPSALARFGARTGLRAAGMRR